MRTKGNNRHKVKIVTLGCAKNLVDSEVLIAQLKGNRIHAFHENDQEHADVVVINTCGFIENAKQESIDTILQFAEAREKGIIEKLYVTGCLSQRYKNDLEKEIPRVDGYFGTHDLPALLRRFRADYKHELVGERHPSQGSHFAYLKISEGCDRPCSFCAIPIMRGKHVSRSIESLTEEARKLASKGVKELLLIAQDSTYYGLDLYRSRKLAGLLNALSEVDGIEWIRMHYAFPSGFPEEVLSLMAENEKICRYIDIPLQHASTKMLQIMRRGIDRPKTGELIRRMRETVPGIAIRTTMLVGHPGETEKDFNELLDFVEKMRFDRLGVFTYSHEEGTHAYNMKDDIPARVKKARAAELMKLQEEISMDLNRKRIGKQYRVLIDRKESGYFIGRTEFDSPEVDNEVLIDADKYYVRTGDFVDAKIIDALPFDLIGQPLVPETVNP